MSREEKVNDYVVSWSVNLFADTPERAVRIALSIIMEQLTPIKGNFSPIFTAVDEETMETFKYEVDIVPALTLVESVGFGIKAVKDDAK